MHTSSPPWLAIGVMWALLSRLLGCSGAAEPEAKAASSPAELGRTTRTAAAADGGASLRTERVKRTIPVSPVEPLGDTGWLGAELRARPDGLPGVKLEFVVPDSPADRAGLRAEDVVVSIEGRAVQAPWALIGRIRSQAPGSRVHLGVHRGSTERMVAVQLSGAPGDDDLLRLLYVGWPAPRFEGLESIRGDEQPPLRAYRGRVLLLEFWAAWCPACRVITPLLNRWSEQYGEHGLSVLGVATHPTAVARNAAFQLGIGYEVAADPTTLTVQAYRGQALPTMFLIDKHGIVRDVMVGYSAARLRHFRGLIRELLKLGDGSRRDLKR